MKFITIEVGPGQVMHVNPDAVAAIGPGIGPLGGVDPKSCVMIAGGCTIPVTLSPAAMVAALESGKPPLKLVS